MYPTSLGAQHMRSAVKLPDSLKLLPQLLREHDYFCTNNSKTDYNLLVDENALWALNSLDWYKPDKQQIGISLDGLPEMSGGFHRRYEGYIPRLIQRISNGSQ